MNQNRCRNVQCSSGEIRVNSVLSEVKPSQLHGIPGLILLTAWYTHTHTHTLLDISEILFRMFLVLKKKKFVLKLKTILTLVLIQSAVIGLSHKDTISNDVYDSGMVFYNVLFVDDKLFTLHWSVFAIFVPTESTNVNSIFAMSESPWRFCTS